MIKIADICSKMPQKGENDVRKALYGENDRNNRHRGIFVGNAAKIELVVLAPVGFFAPIFDGFGNG